MRFVSLGLGAVGGVVAARLALAGHDVTGIARGPHLDAVRRQGGLRLETPEGTLAAELAAVRAPAEVPWRGDEVVLMAVRSEQTAAALQDLVAVAPAGTTIVCLQNGLTNELAASRYFAAVYAVCVFMPASHTEPGVVRADSPVLSGILDVGRAVPGDDDGEGQLAEAFRHAGFLSEVRPDVMAWKRRKLLVNLGNAVEALCGTGPEQDRLVERARAEGRSVFEAAGLPFVSAEQDRQRRAELLSMGGRLGPSDAGTSTTQSLSRGSGSVETDWLNGEVVLLGRVHRVDTPVNALLQAAVRRAWSHGDAPGGWTVDRLLESGEH